MKILIIELLDCMDSIQQLCLASTNQFIEMTRLIDDYKNNTQESIILTGGDSSLDVNLLLKHFSQIVDWVSIKFYRVLQSFIFWFRC